MEVTQQAEPDKKRKKRRAMILLLLLLLFVSAGSWFVYNKLQSGTKIMSCLPDTKTTQKMTGGELKKYADKIVDKDNVTIHVYPKVSISSDGVSGKMWVQNPPVNATGQEASLISDKGETLFDSGLIEPGYQISSIKLNKKLPKGNHRGVISLSFYDLKEKKQV
jgi:hypothetical protein